MQKYFWTDLYAGTCIPFSGNRNEKKRISCAKFKDMIQRKQTIWLFMAALLTTLGFFLPFGIRQTSAVGQAGITEVPLFAGSDTLLMVLTSASILLSLVIIFLFANRPLQLKLILLNMLLTLGSSVFMFFLTQQAEKGNRLVVGLLGNQLCIGVLLPLLALAFLLLAFSGVRSDEKLVKSTDRLR